MPLNRCDVCGKEGTMKRCGRCKQAYYCSVACQKKEWKIHKRNCNRPPETEKSAVQDLLRAVGRDLWPDYPAAQQFGFDNLLKYHGDTPVPSQYGNLNAEHVFLGILEDIKRHFGIDASELDEAYRNNALDDWLHSKIENVFKRFGKNNAGYCPDWLHYKFIIGPTRTTSLTQKQVMQMRNKIYQKYYV